MYKLLRGYKGRIRPIRPILGQVERQPIPVAFEPTRINRFLVTFPESFGISPYFVKSATLPSISIEDNQWNDIEFNLYDPVGPSCSNIIYDLVQNETIFNPIVMKLQTLQPTGDVVSDWTVWGTIERVEFGNLDYDNEDPIEIKMTMAVSNASLAQ